MIDHSLLHPTMTDRELAAGCRLAQEVQGRVGVHQALRGEGRRKAAERLGVAVGTVIGFPHGSSTTESKRYETELACRDGATEIDMVINIGKALGGDWAYVENDIRAVVREAHKRGAIVKVIFENDFLPGDAIKKRLCRHQREGRRGLREDLDRLRLRQGGRRQVQLPGRHRARSGPDAQDRVREGAGEGRRRRARPRRPDARARPGHDTLRRDSDGGDARGIQKAGEGGAVFRFFRFFGCFRCFRCPWHWRLLNGRRPMAGLPVLPAMRRGTGGACRGGAVSV